MADSHRHPANIARHDDRSKGDRWADAVTGYMGSWNFIIIQTIVVTFWIALNIVGLTHHWDPYPFILLNLLFSTQAAYASPLILLAGNRASDHDRQRAEIDYLTNAQSLTLLRRIANIVGLTQDEIEELLELVKEDK